MAEHKTLKGDRQFSTNAEKEVSQLNPILEEIIILVESAQKGDGMMGVGGNFGAWDIQIEADCQMRSDLCQREELVTICHTIVFLKITNDSNLYSHLFV